MKFRKRENWPVERITWQDLLAFEKKLWRMYQKEKDKRSKAKIGLVSFIVSLLMRVPIRAGTLRTIRLGRNLVTQKTATGEKRIFRFFPAEIFINGGESIEISVPRILEPKLEIFLKEIRPALMDKKTEDYLFPGLRGGELSKVALRNILNIISINLLGKSINTNLLRHLAVTHLLMKKSKHHK